MGTKKKKKLYIVRELLNRTTPKDTQQVKDLTRLLEDMTSEMAPTCSSNPRFVYVKRMLAEIAEIEKLLS